MYRVINAGGGQIVAECGDYQDAVAAAVDKYGRETVVGHPGDLTDGGHRTLVWASRERADNDSGYAACAQIVEVPRCSCDACCAGNLQRLGAL